MLLQLIRAQARRSPEAPALHAPGRTALSYAGLEAAVAGVSATLARLGARSDDRIALVCSNGPEMAAAFLGIAAHAGCAPLNAAYRAPEFELFLSDLRPQAVVVESGLDSAVRGVAASLGIPVWELTPHTSASAGEIEISGAAIRNSGLELQPSSEAVALLLHTSGTTSRPKLVPLTQANLCASANHISASLHLTPADVCLNVMPLFHIHGLGAAVLASLASGGSVVCCPGFVAPRFFDWVEEFHPTWYTAVPTIHQSVLARAAERMATVERNPFRFIRSCSAALAPSLMEQMETVFQVPVIEAYGMTEAAHQMAANPLPPGERKPGSVGVAAGPEIAIMDEAGALLPAGAAGEVVIRGSNVMGGYVGNAEANARAFTNGWFRTGDQGHLDEQGYLFLSSRLKELINRAGEKIAPREIDEVLLRHPSVAQAVAFAAPHSRLGEAVAAAVVLRPGATATQGELREFAAARLADFKVPERILFVEEVPKGPTGKIQRIGLASKLGVEEIRPPQRACGEYVPPGTESEVRVAGLFAATLGVDRVGLRDNFLEMGGDSMLMASLLNAIAKSSGVQVPPVAFMDNPTVAGVCRFLEKRELSSALKVWIRSARLSPALFCIPGSDGDIAGFANLAHHLDRDRPVVAFRLPPAEYGDGVYRVEDLAALYFAEVLDAQPEGPLHFAGVCVGGLVAYEMARQAVALGREIGVLSLLDCYNPAWAQGAGAAAGARYRAALLGRRIAYQSRKLRDAGIRGSGAYLRGKLADFAATARNRAEESAYQLLLRAGVRPPASLRNQRVTMRYAASRYVPAPCPGRLHLFRMEEPRVDAYDYPDMGWRGFAAEGVIIHDLPGSHRTMLSEPNVQLVAEQLNEFSSARAFR